MITGNFDIAAYSDAFKQVKQEVLLETGLGEKNLYFNDRWYDKFSIIYCRRVHDAATAIYRKRKEQSKQEEASGFKTANQAQNKEPVIIGEAEIEARKKKEVEDKPPAPDMVNMQQIPTRADLYNMVRFRDNQVMDMDLRITSLENNLHSLKDKIEQQELSRNAVKHNSKPD